MRLYLIRHGKAEASATTDHDRQLTEKGRKKTQKIADVLAQYGASPTVIYASPRVRAQQTAEIIADTLGKTVTTREEVNFDFDAAALRSLVQDLKTDDEAMFVGHNPSMSGVVQVLTGANVDMKTSAVACVQFDGEWAELEWLIMPKLFA